MDEVQDSTSSAERKLQFFEIAEALLDAGATSSTRLHLASLQGSVEAIAAQLAKNVDVNTKDRRGYPIFRYVRPNKSIHMND